MEAASGADLGGSSKYSSPSECHLLSEYSSPSECHLLSEYSSPSECHLLPLSLGHLMVDSPLALYSANISSASPLRLSTSSIAFISSINKYGFSSILRTSSRELARTLGCCIELNNLSLSASEMRNIDISCSTREEYTCSLQSDSNSGRKNWLYSSLGRSSSSL